MATAIHLQRVKDTLANGILSLDDSQIMMLSNTNNELMYREASTFYLCRPHAYTTDGVNFTYVDQDFKSVNVRGDTLAVAKDIQHYADTDTYLRFEDDKLTMVIGGVTFATLTEDTADTLSFFAGIAGTVGFGIATGLARCHIDSDTAFDTASTEADQDTLFLTNNKAGSAAGNIGPSIGFGGPGTDGRVAAFGAYQGGSDADQVGFGFYTHPSTTAGDALVLSAYLTHLGAFVQQRSAGSTSHQLICFSTSNTQSAAIDLIKSSSATIGTYATTAVDETIGRILGYATNANGTPALVECASIYIDQDDTAGANYVAGRIAFYTGTSAAASSERMRLTSAGYLGIGTTAPVSIIDAVSANTPWVIAAANKTDNSAKDGGHAGISYDVDEEPYAMIYGVCGATTNAVIIGGGTSSLNAATSVAIRTAAINTVAGTERMLVDSLGNVMVQTLDLAVMTAGKGLVLKDAGGHYHRITIDTDGTTLLFADLGTTFPVP